MSLLNGTVRAADVTAEIETIVVGDPEYAHSSEDAIHQAVLRAIAEGRTDDPAAVAAAALKTSDVEFPRWYA